jgi:hypothetical protein
MGIQTRFAQCLQVGQAVEVIVDRGSSDEEKRTVRKSTIHRSFSQLNRKTRKSIANKEPPEEPYKGQPSERPMARKGGPSDRETLVLSNPFADQQRHR